MKLGDNSNTRLFEQHHVFMKVFQDLFLSSKLSLTFKNYVLCLNNSK